MIVLACQTPVPQPSARRSVRPSAAHAPSAGTTRGDSTADLKGSSVCGSRLAIAKPAARAVATTPRAPVTASAHPAPTSPPTATAATATTGHVHGEASTAGHALPPQRRTRHRPSQRCRDRPEASQGRAAGRCICPVCRRKLWMAVSSLGWAKPGVIACAPSGRPSARDSRRCWRRS